MKIKHYEYAEKDGMIYLFHLSGVAQKVANKTLICCHGGRYSYRASIESFERFKRELAFQLQLW